MAHTNQIASDQSYSESTVRLKAVKILIGKSPVCRTACQCIKEFELDKQQTEAMVCGTGAAGPLPDLQHQPPGRRHFLLKM